MSDAATATAEDTAAAGVKKGGGILPILVGVNSLLLVGVLAFVALRGTGGGSASGGGEKSSGEHAAAEKSEKSEGGKEGAPAAGPTVRLADFVVHLRNPEADRYVRISFEIEVATDHDRDELNVHVPQLRDAFIGYLSDRTMEELRGSAAMEATKQALLKRAEAAAPNVKIRALYATDVVIQ